MSQDVSRHTVSLFGHEWRRWERFGFEGEAYRPGLDFTKLPDAYREELLAHTVATFPRKTLLRPDEIAGKRVLDVGCGNGRYSAAAALAGASAVTAIDPSEGADAARSNLAEFPNVTVRRMAIDELDAGGDSFDVIFSIGVLQHMADPAGAVKKLVGLLAPGGVLAVHVYRKRNPVSRAAMRLVRPLTSRLDHRVLWRVCAVPTFIGRLTSRCRYAHAAANFVLPCYPNRQQNFDWYGPPRAEQFEPDEVRRWLADAGLGDIEDDDPYSRADSYYNRIYPAWMKDAGGCLKPWVRYVFGPMGLTVRGKTTACRRFAKRQAAG